MEPGVQIAAEILETIKSGSDIYILDQLIKGPDRLGRARKLLLEHRDSCQDPDDVALFNSIISELDKGSDDTVCAGP